MRTISLPVYVRSGEENPDYDGPRRRYGEVDYDNGQSRRIFAGRICDELGDDFQIVAISDPENIPEIIVGNPPAEESERIAATYAVHQALLFMIKKLNQRLVETIETAQKRRRGRPRKTPRVNVIVEALKEQVSMFELIEQITEQATAEIDRRNRTTKALDPDTALT